MTAQQEHGPRPTVLVTGSAGEIGTALRRGLPAAGWRVRGLDRIEAEPLAADEEALVGDVADPALLARGLAGASGVVHLASAPDEQPLEQVLDSHVRTTGAVLEAARQAGVGRVVLASSNHAVGFAPRTERLGVDVRPQPDTFYGVGKVAMEALGSLYVDRYGLDVVCLRIGSFLERPTSRRALSTWLSPDDAVRLAVASLTAPSPGFAVVYGISNNARAWWDLEPGRRLGYLPRDDAETWAQEILATPETDADRADAAFVGGPMTGADYDIDRLRSG